MMLLASELAAVEMRVRGATYDEIALAGIGYNCKSAAYKAVQRALKRRAAEPVETVRQLEVSRLDALLGAVWDRALRVGLPDDINSVLKIMKRRAALLGLDAPKKIDITDTVRGLAELQGLDPDMAIRETYALIEESKAVER